MRWDIRAIGGSRVGNPPVAAKSRLRSACAHAIVECDGSSGGNCSPSCSLPPLLLVAPARRWRRRSGCDAETRDAPAVTPPPHPTSRPTPTATRPRRGSAGGHVDVGPQFRPARRALGTTPPTSSRTTSRATRTPAAAGGHPARRRVRGRLGGRSQRDGDLCCARATRSPGGRLERTAARSATSRLRASDRRASRPAADGTASWSGPRTDERRPDRVQAVRAARA